MQFCRLVTPRGSFKEGKNCLLPMENVSVGRDFLTIENVNIKLEAKNGLWTVDCGLGIKDRLRYKTRTTDRV